MNVNSILAVVAALPIVGCAASPTKLEFVHLAEVQMTGDCELTVWLNSEPAIHLRGTHSAVLDITNFVVDGANTARMTSSGSNGEASVAVFRSRGMADVAPVKVVELSLQLGSDEQSKEARGFFDAAVPFAWAWQEAAELQHNIGDSEEREIYAELEKTALAVYGHDWNAMVESRAGWLDDSHYKYIPEAWYRSEDVVALARRERETCGHISDVRLAPADSLVFIVGERLVRVEGKDYRGGLHDKPETKVIRATVRCPAARPDGDLVVGDKYVYAAKLQNRWRIFTANYLATLARQ